MWAGDEAVYLWDHERPDWADPKPIAPSFDALLAELHTFDPRLDDSQRLTGDRLIDEAIANRSAGQARTPRGFTWHHVEDGKTMQLVPSRIHSATGHTGGLAVIQNGGFDPRS